MKKLKKVIWLIIGLIIGISTAVGAATIFRSEDITYSSSSTTKKNVKDSLDELYNKVSKIGECPNGKWCYDEPMSLSDKVKIGDYISMKPTATSYKILKADTGYTADQTINPSELNLWRVIRKNEDGTVDIISEYVSSKVIYLKGKAGYYYDLQDVTSQYTLNTYVKSGRLFSYTKDGGDTVAAVGTLIAKNPSGIAKQYWTKDEMESCCGENSGSEKVYIGSDGKDNTILFYSVTGKVGSGDAAVRPVVTLNSSIGGVKGNGTKDSPYVLN